MGTTTEDSVTTTDTGLGTTASPGSGTGSTASPTTGAADLGLIHDVAERLMGAMTSVIEGKPDVVRTTVTVLFAGGHLLIEDVPGVGKTMLAKTLARSIDATVRRIQFTPDLLPSDVTGVSIFNQDARRFEFRPGAIFANVVVGDEINRASPKTQSALLESMEERQVTVDGTTYTLQAPFIVMATQNPIEMEGTYPLPEAQRDRFMARISMGYPAPSAEPRPARDARLELTARRPDTGDRRRDDQPRRARRQPGPREPRDPPVHRRPRDPIPVDDRAAARRVAACRPAPAARVPGLRRARGA